jgi:hypothetical protein
MARISDAALYKKFQTLGHRHFCSDRTCRRIYQCLAVIYLRGGCPNPRVNGRCAPCRGYPVPETFEIAWAPRECCRNNVRQITDRDELLSHRLAGPGPWFKCKTCARCHGWPQGHKFVKE